MSSGKKEKRKTNAAIESQKESAQAPSIIAADAKKRRSSVSASSGAAQERKRTKTSKKRAPSSASLPVKSNQPVELATRKDNSHSTLSRITQVQFFAAERLHNDMCGEHVMKVRATMLPFLLDAVISEGDLMDDEDAMPVIYRIQNNHNHLQVKTALEICNNVYGNPIDADLKDSSHARRAGTDMHLMLAYNDKVSLLGIVYIL
jgi:hypothetical protein